MGGVAQEGELGDTAAVSAPQESDLRKALELKEREALEFKDKWLRALAEADNARKRSEKEHENSLLNLRAWCLEQFLPVLDQLQAGVRELGRAQASRPVQEGIGLVLKNLEKIFMDQGVFPVPAEAGRPLDPLFHEAARVEPTQGEDGVILHVEREGYQMGGRVLRPARVVISGKKE